MASPFIIAEIGSNFRNLDDCLHSISMAKVAGADAVKFQLFDEIALYGMVLDRADIYSTVPSSLRDNVRAWMLQLEWLPALKTKADAVGIEFMCSAFSPELLDAVDPFVRVHKLASAELTHVRMLEKLAKLGKPVIVSTGASGRKDIERALEILKPLPVFLLYCVAAYPAGDIDFRMMEELKAFGHPVGFSDHTVDWAIIPKAAVDAGACIIEKHMTDIPDVQTPDRPHSLTVDQFKRMVQTIRGERPFQWGSGEEKAMILRHNRRLIATQDVAHGAQLLEGVNFGIYRSLKDDTHALSPFHVANVHGKIAAKAIKAGDGIGPGDFS